MSTDEGSETFDKNVSIPDVVEENPFKFNRIFINQVDSFNARHISAYITDQFYGALRAAAEEVGNEGMEEEVGRDKPKPYEVSKKYEVVGTVRNKLGRVTEDIFLKLDESDQDYFYNEIFNCGVIVYDITQDPGEIPKALACLKALEEEIDKVKDVGPKTFRRYDVMRVFILISTAMTWANTKPIDPDEPETPFNESDYKKRKAHPNFTEQIACEREVVLKGRKYKEKLRTFVLCCGILYGFEEEDLSFLFRMAWNNEKYMPVFMPGNNNVPLLHVNDLAKILHALIEMVPKKPQYILAVEQTPCNLRQVVRALSKAMGRSRTKDVPKEAAFLYKNMTQSLYDRYTVNLNMEPSFVVEELGIEYRSDLNLVENMKKIVNEFRTTLNLLPIKIFIHGPPAVGKTNLAKQICGMYGLHYISVKTMIEETIEDWNDLIDEEIKRRKAKEEKIKNMPAEEEDEDEEVEEEEDEGVLEDLQEKLRDLETTLANSDNGKIPDDYVIRLMKTFLSHNICQNQGYVLDAFPKTMVQVKELFGSAAEGGGGEEEAGEEEEDAGTKFNIVPAYVVSLEATDDFLCERVMNFPEKDVQETHYTEEHMLRRLKEFRMNNTESNTILNFFDENEIHPIIINTMEDDSIDMQEIFRSIQHTLGRPIGFPFSLEEQEEILRCQEEADRLREEQDKLNQEILEHEALEEYQIKMEEKIHMLTELQMEEEKLLAAQCEPLRNYLMKYIFPTLTEGLLEVAHVKPNDPVDYLAEYLFKSNPEGKMFDPTYTRQGELIEAVIKTASIERSIEQAMQQEE